MKKLIYPLIGLAIAAGWPLSLVYMANVKQATSPAALPAAEAAGKPGESRSRIDEQEIRNRSEELVAKIRKDDAEKAQTQFDAERAAALAVQRSRLTLLNDRAEGVLALCDERVVEQKRWAVEIDPLLDNENGKHLAAARFAKDVRVLMDEKETYRPVDVGTSSPISDESVRRSVAYLLGPVLTALKSPRPIAVGEGELSRMIAALETEVRTDLERLRKTRTAILRLVSDAKSVPVVATGKTLRAAFAEQDTEATLRHTITVRVAEEKENAQRATRWVPVRLKLLEKLGREMADGIEAAFADKPAPGEGASERLTVARQQLREKLGKLEADEIESAWRWTRPR